MANVNISSVVLIPPQSTIPAVDSNGVHTPAWQSFFHQIVAPKVNYINSTYINTITTTPITEGVTINQQTSPNAYNVSIGLSPVLSTISTLPNSSGALTNNGSGNLTYTPLTTGTITTPITGILKGNGSTIVQAIAGVDYALPGGVIANLSGGVLGSVPYQSAPSITALLAPNTTNNPMFLQSQGTGSAGLAPTWTSNLTVNSLVCSSSLSTTTYIYCGLQGTNEQSGVYYYQNTAQTPTISSSIIDASGTVPTVGNLWLHHHSTVSPCTLYGSHSNSSTTSHAPLTLGQGIFNITAMGSTQTGSLSYEYQPFGTLLFSADTTGTISATSAPGQFQILTTPTGTTTPTVAMTINNAQNTTFAGTITSGGKAVPTETDSTWTPSFTNLTVVGTPTYTGKYKQIGNCIFWTLTVSSTTSTTSVLGSTWFTLPTTPSNVSTFTAGTANIGSYGVGTTSGGAGYCPSWTTEATVNLSGFYFTT